MEQHGEPRISANGLRELSPLLSSTMLLSPLSYSFDSHPATTGRAMLRKFFKPARSVTIDRLAERINRLVSSSIQGGISMHELHDIVGLLNPRQTVLLLGAGASVPSGAPTGAQMAQRLALQIPSLKGNETDYTLSEVCSIFERTKGRQALVQSVRAQLSSLSPTGGLKLLPRFDWPRIYSTNFDTLVEEVYRAADRRLEVLKSNFDFSRLSEPNEAVLYKIHGCVTQDVAFGQMTRMLLTEEDYENYAEFRQASFRALELDVLTKDVLVIGQSLADPHLKRLVTDALKLHASAGAPGRVFVLAFDRDENRARLLEDRGALVTFGGFDELCNALVEEVGGAELLADTSFDGGSATLLPAELIGVTTDLFHATSLQSNAKRLFNGSPAAYADIAAGLTFMRSSHGKLRDSLLLERPIAAIVGAGGVGKTTLARQIVADVAQSVDAAWEHNNAFPFRPEFWIEYEGRLRERSQAAILLVDDCTDNLSGVSRLVDHLGRTPSPALRLVLTANTGKWRNRSKSRYIFSHGEVIALSQLDREDLGGLLDLLDRNQQIRELVDGRFLNKGRSEQLRVLRERCSADMYVCMKNVFASEELDHILLREFAELAEPEQQVYRHVAALEALGAQVHRQLVIRTLGLDAGTVSEILGGLTDVVSEYDVQPKLGLYGWATRHKEVAKAIARYKYAEQVELERLFDNLIDSLNPSVWMEVASARSLCTDEFGIDRLTNLSIQLELLQRIISLLPGERIPRHRYIRKLIDSDHLSEASSALQEAIGAVGKNPVLGRYDVLLRLRQAETTGGIMDEDRRAMLVDAVSRAQNNLRTYPSDKHSYRTYGDAAAALAAKGGDIEPLRDAMEKVQEAEGTMLDPEITDYRQRIQSELRKYGKSG
jgi:hypothetical protein